MKKRIIPTILIDSGGKVVISKKFDPWRTVGMLMQSLKMHDQRCADELLILDINATAEKREISSRIFKIISNNVRIPITIGGGIQNISTAKRYINSGADKICLNSLCINNIELIREMSSSLGAQAIVINVTYVWQDDVPYIYHHQKKMKTDIEVLDFINNIIRFEIGEMILTSVDNDGMLNGFDEKIIDYIKGTKINVPIVLSGGSGNANHYINIFMQHSVSALAGGSIFAITENTPKTLREICGSNGISGRKV